MRVPLKKNNININNNTALV